MTIDQTYPDQPSRLDNLTDSQVLFARLTELENRIGALLELVDESIERAESLSRTDSGLIPIDIDPGCRRDCTNYVCEVCNEIKVGFPLHGCCKEGCPGRVPGFISEK